jgi:hypothetical protein
LQQIIKIVGADWESKAPEEIKKQPFYKDITGDLQAIKIAWRNPTMHIVKTYDRDAARQIFACVKQLMARLCDAGLME